jgi:Domain of unknown function (DUF4062)
MRKRKLQVFLSSTYEDLIDHRLAAMEAVLAAGHIPAAMEQFSPGDETAWEKITAWIDESDAFILILGGRYGSVEPKSGKSFVQLEYEYASERKKPFFALVVSDAHHEQRVKECGLAVDERERPERYREFKRLVTERLCAYWNDKKDIKTAIFQKLPEWSQRSDVVGWVRANEAANPEVMNELARLSQENRELRTTASARAETFEGLTFDELADVLRRAELPSETVQAFMETAKLAGINPESIGNSLELFEAAFDVKMYLPRGHAGSVAEARYNQVIGAWSSLGLLAIDTPDFWVISPSGRRFRNILRVRHP